MLSLQVMRLVVITLVQWERINIKVLWRMPAFKCHEVRGVLQQAQCSRHLRHRPAGDLRMLTGYSGRLYCDPDTSGSRMLLAAVATLDRLFGVSLLAASVMASFVWVLVNKSLWLHA